MANLDEKLAKLLTKKRCVKLLNELITPNETGIIENPVLKEKLEFCGFTAFSLKECVKFASDNDSNIIVIGEIETIDENGAVISVPKIKKAFNAGTAENPDMRFAAEFLIKSFNYRYAEKIAEYNEKKKEEAKAESAKNKKSGKSEKVETEEEKQQRMRIARELEKEHKKQQREEFKNKILTAKDLAELKKIQTELESLKLQSPDLYSIIKSMRIKLQPVTLSKDLENIGTAQQSNVASK